jgi:hypothetical protein
MDTHKNARLTPKGREEELFFPAADYVLARRVVTGGL